MNLYLIGFRGCGKSTIAPLLAETIGWKAVDTDDEIEVLTGQTIAQIFAEEGEAGFREWETTVVTAYTSQSEHVVSLGGGVLTVPENRIAIRKSGYAVWLTADADVIWNRIQSDSKNEAQRPKLTELDGADEVAKLLAARNETYAACADYTIDTSKMTPDAIADHIANWWDPVDT